MNTGPRRDRPGLPGYLYLDMDLHTVCILERRKDLLVKMPYLTFEVARCFLERILAGLLPNGGMTKA